MDIQNWLIPLLSLVGGAGGAAIINTVYGMKKQKQDRLDEHTRWLRDKKQEAYVDFFESTRLVLSQALSEGDTFVIDAVNERFLAVMGSPIHLLAPKIVRAEAATVRDDVSNFVDLASDADLPAEVRRRKLAELKLEVEARRSALVELCRIDLAIVGSNDG